MTPPATALRSLAFLAVIAVISGGCSRGSARSGNPSQQPRHHLPRGAASTPGSTNAAAGHNGTATLHEKAVTYAACMRRHGVVDFPAPNASGAFPAFPVTADPAVWDRSLAACESLKPPGTYKAELTPRQMSRRLKFARCIREHGVKDFPDPEGDAPLVDPKRIPSAATPAGRRALNAAILQCEGFVGG